MHASIAASSCGVHGLSETPQTRLELPLQFLTEPGWVAFVLASPLELLADHAHLEKKAAANALEILGRFPFPPAPDEWSTRLVAIAHDETSHLKQVLRLLHRRGGQLGNFHRNPYAGELHKLCRMGKGTDELLDRLLVAALIEARSCERFALLADPDLNPDQELRRFYLALMASELGHYNIFIQLSALFVDASVLEARWAWMLAREAEIMAEQPPVVRMHGGFC